MEEEIKSINRSRRLRLMLFILRRNGLNAGACNLYFVAHPHGAFF